MSAHCPYTLQFSYYEHYISVFTHITVRVCVCVCVCVCVVGEPPFSRPQSTEFLLRLLQMPIPMLPALHLTFVHIRTYT